MSEHLVLLGDSILDNRTYTSPEPETAECLRGMLGSGWTVDLLARDGAVMSEIPYQLEHLRGHPDAIVVSVGGNDALGHIGILEDRADAARTVLSRLADIAEDFGARYRRVLAEARPRSRRLIACTIYEPPMFDATTTRLLRVPLCLLNDQIVREAARAGVDVLDLRSVCTSPVDFVRQIEPSAQGAHRIAAAIETAVRGERSAADGAIERAFLADAGEGRLVVIHVPAGTPQRLACDASRRGRSRRRYDGCCTIGTGLAASPEI